MIDVTNPEKMLEEIIPAENARDAYLGVVPDLVSIYVGSQYGAFELSDDPAPENHPYEWLSWITPKIVFDNPKVEVSMSRSGLDPSIGERFAHGLNQWCTVNHLWKQLLSVWYDVAFCYGVMRISTAPIPGYRPSENRHWASAKRVDPWRFIIDQRCSNAEDARFAGHVWRRDKNDLLQSNDPTLDKDVIEAMTPDAHVDKIEPLWLQRTDSTSRNEIIGYEMWVPELTLPGYEDNEQIHGTILTLGVSHGGGSGRSKPQWIRKPRPYWGSNLGPYELFGTYLVPGKVLPLSPLIAMHDELVEINAHGHALSVGAANWKRFALFDATNPEVGKAAESAKHGEIKGVSNGAKDLTQVEIGGNAPEQYEYYQFLRERIQRRSGMSDAARGEVTGDGSATEYADAAAQRDSRVELIRRVFTEHTRRVIWRAGWGLYHSEMARFDLGPEAATALSPRPMEDPPAEDAPRIAAELLNGAIPMPPEFEGLDYDALVTQIRLALAWNPIARFPTDDDAADPEGELAMIDLTGVPYELLQLTIDPMSMARTDQALVQKLAQDKFALVKDTASLMVENDHIDWPELLDDWGHAHNQKRFSKVLKVGRLMEKQRQNQLQMEMAPAPGAGPAGFQGSGPPMPAPAGETPFSAPADPGGGEQIQPGLLGNHTGAELAAAQR